MRIARGILRHRDEARHAAAALVFAAHGVAGALGRDHDHVEIGARLDQAEMDVEPVGESERRALLEVGDEVVGIDRRLVLVGGDDHDDVGPLRRIGVRQHLEAGAFRLLRGGRAGAQRDGDVLDPAVAQVLGVGVALAAIAEDGDLLAGDQVDVAIGVVIDFHVRYPSIWFVCPANAAIHRPDG